MKTRTAELKSKGIHPKLATILVGDDPASKTYLASKHKACLDVGINSENHTLPVNTDEATLGGFIETLNKNDTVHGILLQLPLPKHLDAYKMIEKIVPEKDVDGLTSRNMGLLVYGKPKLIPCTPKGVVTLLRHYKIDLKGRPTVIINRSHLVGKPLAHLMMAEDATVTVCHSKSKDLQSVMRGAEILVSAVGRRPGFTVTADSVRDGAVVVDVAINRVDEKICGDVDYSSVSQKASWISPVPGGIGPMTVVMLVENTLIAASGT